ncbi:hypothetical protein GTQ40_06380 [Flavobacteriaceae bacterium R38]|nr:hypothetical protein [Flavobacteriaceae bacterium R38]
MKNTKIGLIAVSALFLIFSISCNTEKKEKEKTPPQNQVEEVKIEISYDTNTPKSIIKAIEAASGGWGKLWKQKDVEFNYNYLQADGTADKSIERYVFHTEQSWGKYTQHDINVMPGTDGEVIQYYDGENAHISQNGTKIEDPTAIGSTQFLRKANYFWFVMMYKLDNPGVLYEYNGSENVNGTDYDKVTVTYDPEVTKKEQNDIYVLYVNKETKMVDQFYFSLPAFGFNDPVLLMKVNYEEVNGLMIPAKRDIFFPGEDGSYGDQPAIQEISTNIKFNNGFTEADLSI